MGEALAATGDREQDDGGRGSRIQQEPNSSQAAQRVCQITLLFTVM